MGRPHSFDFEMTHAIDIPSGSGGRGDEPPDEALARAAQGGDKRAFVEVVVRHQAMVCGVTFAILRDFEAAEDAAQDAFLTAWRKIHDLREPARLKGWLARIARTAALEHRRRRHPHEALHEANEPADEAPLPDERAASDEEAALVCAAMDRLPESLRLPLVLFYRDGRSVRQVAAALELSEEAVKQRLTRGRALLRERVAGLVESVLVRTQPGAVFTMSIAAAIGALAAPAAVAGTVFGATVAAGAAGTTSTAADAAGATLATATMSTCTSKTSLAVAAAIAITALPLGYSARMGLEPSFNAAPPSASTALPAAPRHNEPDFSDSAFFAEWQALHETWGVTADAMPLLYQAISEIGDPVRRRAFRAAQIAEWAAVDPQGGMAFFFASDRDTIEREQFFQEWLQYDPAAAAVALLQTPSHWEEVARQSLSRLAALAPESVSAIVARLPKTRRYRETHVSDAFAVLAANDLDHARAAAEALAGPNRELALAGVAKTWAQRDADAALAWAETFPDELDRNEVRREALAGLAATNPAKALDLAGTVPPLGSMVSSTHTTGARILAEAARADYEATLAWLKEHPGRMSDGDLWSMGAATAEKLNADPRGFLDHLAAGDSLGMLMPALQSALHNGAGGQWLTVWEWLRDQPERPDMQRLRMDMIQAVSPLDPERALRMVAELSDANLLDDRDVQQVAGDLMDGEHALHRFDDLVEKAPERLRGPMLEKLFDYLQPNTFRDPQPWIARIEQLPEADRPGRIGQFMEAWATHSPEEAIAWASALPEQETRSEALAEAASAWAARDPYQASEWIASRPPGLNPDDGAGALARALAQEAPEEAWAWMLSIREPTRRASSAWGVLQTMHPHYPDTALQWLENAPLLLEDKTRLRQAWLPATSGQ